MSYLDILVKYFDQKPSQTYLLFGRYSGSVSIPKKEKNIVERINPEDEARLRPRDLLVIAELTLQGVRVVLSHYLSKRKKS